MNNYHVFGSHEKGTINQLAEIAQRATRAALMADGHVGYRMPIGGVAAYHEQVSVAGVGFDIACGNAAIRTNLKAQDLNLEHVADLIEANISFGVGRKNKSDDAPTEHPLFEDPAWDAVPITQRANLLDKAKRQLGTVGSGNHYVDVFADESDQVWVGVHFGSRGLGHSIAQGFMNLVQDLPWHKQGGAPVEGLLDLDSVLGEAYWSLMNLAGQYAYAGREWAARKVVALMGGQELELIHNHHNFAWKERHQGESLVVVRKGATPAFEGQKGFVGGSMGDNAVILQGTANPNPETRALQEQAMYSTVHGAGRVMSRTQAAGKRHRKTGKLITQGQVTEGAMRKWLKEKEVILRGGGLDESPHAYRRLPEVLEAQGDTIQVLHSLKPLVVVMAAASEFDPYKD